MKKTNSKIAKVTIQLELTDLPNPKKRMVDVIYGVDESKPTYKKEISILLYDDRDSITLNLPQLNLMRSQIDTAIKKIYANFNIIMPDLSVYSDAIKN